MVRGPQCSMRCRPRSASTCLELGQQGLGGQGGLQNRGGIQIGRLRIGPAHGKGLVVLALPRHFDVRMPLQSDQGLIEQSAPIAQVRT